LIIFITELEGTINQSIWELFWNGSVFIKFYAIDNAGNVEFSEVEIRKNLFAPVITVISPSSYRIVGKTSPNFTLYIDGSNIDKIWYTLNYGTKKHFFTGTMGKIGQEAWDLIGNENAVIHFYINDTLNNVGYDLVILYKDISSPILSLIDPINNTVWNSQPIINISVFDSHLDFVWYEVDNTKIQIENYVDIALDNLIWENLPQGMFIINFYANDSAGNVNHKCFNMCKDTLPPLITINLPISNITYGRESPDFDLVIYESHLDKCWYTIDDGITNFTFSRSYGKINQSTWEIIWDYTKNGDNITITFYANDTLGQIGFKEIKLTKYDDTRSFDLMKILNDNMPLIFLGLSFGGIGVVLGVSNNLRYNITKKKQEKRKIGKIVILCIIFVGLIILSSLI
jgi:hypothetical protein